MTERVREKGPINTHWSDRDPLLLLLDTRRLNSYLPV